MFCAFLFSVDGQKSLFRAINITSSPVELSDYGITEFYRAWLSEVSSDDSEYGPSAPHVSGILCL